MADFIFGIQFEFNSNLPSVDIAIRAVMTPTGPTTVLQWNPRDESKWAKLFVQSIPKGASIFPGTANNSIIVGFSSKTEERKKTLQDWHAAEVEKNKNVKVSELTYFGQ